MAIFLALDFSRNTSQKWTHIKQKPVLELATSIYQSLYMYGAERRQHPTPLGPQHQLLLSIPLITSTICSPTSQTNSQFVRDNIPVIPRIWYFCWEVLFTYHQLLEALLQDPGRFKSEKKRPDSLFTLLLSPPTRDYGQTQLMLKILIPFYCIGFLSDCTMQRIHRPSTALCTCLFRNTRYNNWIAGPNYKPTASIYGQYTQP